MGRLLVRNPSIHLLDEPLSNLDANLRNSMRTQLAKLHAEHQKTTLFVTHDQVEAMTLGQKLCVMNHGKIIQIASPAEIYNHPKNRFVAEFFGSPNINLFQGEIVIKENETRFLYQNISLAIPENPYLTSGPIELGIRPEDWEVKSIASSNSINANLKRIEDLGDARILYFDSELGHITIKSDKNNFKPGQTIFLSPKNG